MRCLDTHTSSGHSITQRYLSFRIQFFPFFSFDLATHFILHYILTVNRPYISTQNWLITHQLVYYELFSEIFGTPQNTWCCTTHNKQDKHQSTKILLRSDLIFPSTVFFFFFFFFTFFSVENKFIILLDATLVDRYFWL